MCSIGGKVGSRQLPMVQIEVVCRNTWEQRPYSVVKYNQINAMTKSGISGGVMTRNQATARDLVSNNVTRWRFGA